MIQMTSKSVYRLIDHHIMYTHSYRVQKGLRGAWRLDILETESAQHLLSHIPEPFHVLSRRRTCKLRRDTRLRPETIADGAAVRVGAVPQPACATLCVITRRLRQGTYGFQIACSIWLVPDAPLLHIFGSGKTDGSLSSAQLRSEYVDSCSRTSQPLDSVYLYVISRSHGSSSQLSLEK